MSSIDGAGDRNGQPRVVVTGLGPLCAAGAGRDALWSSIAVGRTPADDRPAVVCGIPWTTYRAYRLPAPLAPDPRDLPDLAAADLPPDGELRLSVAAMRLAAADAGLTPEAL